MAFSQNEQYQFSHLDITNGLSNNEVNCIYKDTKGFMWFGTMAGLNRYDGYKFKVFKNNTHDTTSISDDFISIITQGPFNMLWMQTRSGFNIYNPLTEHFDRNIRAALSRISIPGSYINQLKKDKFDNFWFLLPLSGVYKYNSITGKTIHLTHRTLDTTSIYSDDLTDLSQDSKGDIWLVHRRGVIEKLDHNTNKITKRIYNINDIYKREINPFKLYIDRQDDLWMFSVNNPLGVYYINTNKNIFKHIDKSSPGNHLNADIVTNIIQDDKNIIWVATDHGGINLINKSDLKIQYLVNREDDNKSLAQNSTISIYKDNMGIVWIGTYKEGISYYHEDIIKFPLYKHHSSDPKSLSNDDVNKFAEDEKGNLWIGTNGKGLIYFNRKNGSFTTYQHDVSNTNSLTNNIIVSLCLDHEHKLWIGTYFGGLDCYDGKTFTHYRHNNSIPTSISDDRIWEIMEDSSHRLWIGTLDGGLNLLEPNTHKFIHYKADGSSAIHSNYISGLVEDENKNLWISTSYGIDVLMNKTQKFQYYSNSQQTSNSLIHNNVTNLMEDSRHLFWIATRGGLSILDKSKNQFINLRKEDGLPDNAILDILEDDNHNMWVSTPNGLSNIILSYQNNKLNFQFENYDETDGLQGRAFNENASLKTKTGELIFGGPHGFNIFKPSVIKSNKSTPVLVLTDFQVFNKSVNAGDSLDRRIILTKAISETKNITLNYNESAFSIEFADLNLFNPGKVKLEYMLEGFDKGWTISDNHIRKATYTNLDPGEYVFKVKWVGKKISSDENPLKLAISIRPPYWKTTWAYLIYILSFVTALFYIRHRGIQKIEMKYALEREREAAHRMHELDMMKIKFFTNVSHEFRTPLALIMAPVDKIIKQTEEPEQKRQLQMINRNARRLLNMVNQLLDFRKMEVQELKLHARKGDIVNFIQEISYSFSDVAEKKNIVFVFDSEIESFEINFDHDKIERIIFNLLSNAFKFTPERGHVSVLLTLNEKISKAQFIEIKVIDTGIGIPLNKQEKIFERFFQNDVPGSMVNQGSGIGLAITKEFVKLHNGEISVDSEPEMGSCFTVLFPVNIPSELTERSKFVQQVGENQTLDSSYVKVLPSDDTRIHKKNTVLIVEDNEDFRFYLKDNLIEHFNIFEAANGKEGWQKTLALHPNLVVSDISMPEMNGIDLCRKIRNDKRTSHIPVVLLTALTGEEQQLQGLETGANDYMTKPFNFEILLSKLKNILTIQADMRKTYQKQVEVKPTELIVESVDSVFIKKVLHLIEKNIANPDFSVEELSGEMYVSRGTLYKKILALTGKTPVELIRSVRLKRAAQLLTGGQLTISQISYKVGFKSQKYFVRSFKAEFNCVPSAYINQDKLDQPKTNF